MMRYDAEGRQVRIENPAAATVLAEYDYDADGRRVVKKSGGTVTQYLYDAGGQLLVEYGGAAVTAATTRYLVQDHLGSTRLVVDEAGVCKGRMDYAPFGAEIARTWPCYGAVGETDRKFTGQARDGESGLDYFGARYLASTLGRMNSPDPLMASAVARLPQSWNRYSYVLNNPLGFVDPTGLAWESTGNAGNPYSWVDSCGDAIRTDCFSAVAAVVGAAVRVYGSTSSNDITDYAGTEVTVRFNSRSYGVGPVTGTIVDAAFVFGSADAHVQNRANGETYLSLENAAALFNAGVYYHSQYPNDQSLMLTGGSLSTGYGAAVHREGHALGRAIDLGYMGSDGRVLFGGTASSLADAARMETVFAGLQGNPGQPIRQGFVANQTQVDRMGGANRGYHLAAGHENHVHFQKMLNGVNWR